MHGVRWAGQGRRHPHVGGRDPAGIESGQRIRITGAGHAGESGAHAGDLYVLVHVEEDDRFRREGSDLVSVVEIPATEAMLGGTSVVPTLDGDQEIEIKPGTQPGDRVVLRAQGLPDLRGSRAATSTCS